MTPLERARKPVVFLDRDGVINAGFPHHSVRSWDEFAFLPGSVEAIRDLTRAGLPIFVISNQRGVALGLSTAQTLASITRQMLQAIQAAGGHINAVLYCTHDEPDGCACRKPRRGLIDQACQRYPVDLARSYLVGDDPRDIALGTSVGCRTILVLSGRTTGEMLKELPQTPDQICRDLREAAAWILNHERAVP